MALDTSSLNRGGNVNPGRVSNPFQGAGSPVVPDLSGLFRDRKQANVFSTVSAALQMRREVERQEREDRLAEKQALIQERQLDRQLAADEESKRQFDVTSGISMETLGLKREDIERKKNAASDAKRTIQELLGSDGLKPGASASFKDPITGITVSTPLIPRPTTEETNVLSAAQTTRNTIPSIAAAYQAGVLDTVDKDNDVKAFFGQSMAGGAGGDLGRFIISKYGEDAESLVALSSSLNNLKTNYFALAGKALTKPEKEIVGGLLSPVGKTNEQRISDLNAFQKLFTAKEELIRNGIINPQTGDGADAFNSILSSVSPSSSVPSVGQMFNGEKVTKVKKISD